LSLGFGVSIFSSSLFARKSSIDSMFLHDASPTRERAASSRRDRKMERVASSPRDELRDTLREAFTKVRNSSLSARGVVGADLGTSQE
jgi:hypothetical protein